jgi:hypothetical protein
MQQYLFHNLNGYGKAFLIKSLDWMGAMGTGNSPSYYFVCFLTVIPHIVGFITIIKPTM